MKKVSGPSGENLGAAATKHFRHFVGQLHMVCQYSMQSQSFTQGKLQENKNTKKICKSHPL